MDLLSVYLFTCVQILMFQMIELNPNNFQTAGLRVLFDVSFFIIVTTIALTIVFGIVVDTFSELRDEKVHG